MSALRLGLSEYAPKTRFAQPCVTCLGSSNSHPHLSLRRPPLQKVRRSTICKSSGRGHVLLLPCPVRARPCFVSKFSFPLSGDEDPSNEEEGAVALGPGDPVYEVGLPVVLSRDEKELEGFGGGHGEGGEGAESRDKGR